MTPECWSNISKTLSNITYCVSGGLVVNWWAPFLKFLDHNAAAMGVLIGFFTFVANLCFRWLEYVRGKNDQ